MSASQTQKYFGVINCEATRAYVKSSINTQFEKAPLPGPFATRTEC